MNARSKINNILKTRVMILDGAIGTELQKQGMPSGVCPEFWCLKNPGIIRGVHSAYCRAGSDIIYSSTFGANRIKLKQYKLENKLEQINRKLVLLAKEAAGSKVLVSGDIGPTGKLIQPSGRLDFEAAVEVFKEQVRALERAGADLFTVETMSDIQEARAALIAVKESSSKFVIVTLTFGKDARTLSGTDPRTALITLQSLGADAIGVNCSSGPQEMLKLIEQMKPYASVPLVAKPNAGIPKLVRNKTFFEMGAKEFSSYAVRFVNSGVNMLGGCCGTTPEHIQGLKFKITGKKPVLPLRRSISALSSMRSSLIIEGVRKPIIAGEKINPTGKNKLQKELRRGDFSLIRQIAKEEENEGALLLDVNVGVSGIDEEKVMAKTIAILSTITDLPLVVDSSDIRAIEKAVRFYPGRVLINSISGEKERLRKLLPLAAKYGSMFILLPLSGKEIPETFQKRRKIIKEVFKKAVAFGFTKDDIVVDGLALSASSHPEGVEETLKTIDWCKRYFKVNSIVGLSNISFGMPERKIMNAAYLEMAAKRGLTLAIADPLIKNIRLSPVVSRMVKKNAGNTREFIRYFSQVRTPKQKTPAVKASSLEDKISQAVLEGNLDRINFLLKQSVEKEMDASSIIYKIMIPAITKVGELFEKKVYFLPQLIASAETMKKGFNYLEPKLKKEKSLRQARVDIIMATVKGDIHDIGKNIVSLVLKNHGLKVIDLGKDVPNQKIIQAIRRYQPRVVGLSALMTTTMIRMKEIIDLARSQGLNSIFLVGGAVLNERYANSIRAIYARDAVEAANKVVELTRSVKAT
ncbi:MAG: homocysteine S-methyltransferase family protein [Candidatus Omnitrophica bacterium]|nr:homocysteine S-methyltransferase family protein [Candidatus Omnitrophota bacterium]